MLFIIKASLMLMLLNMHCFSHVFGRIIPKCTEITAIIATGAMCLRLLTNGKGFNKVKKTVTPMVVFFVYCFAAGVGLTIFGLYYINLVYPLVEKILVMVLIAYIIYNDESPRFVLNLCVWTAAATAIATLMKMDQLYLRVQLSEAMSSNLIGMVCASGALTLSMLQSKFYNRYIKLALNVLFMSAVVLTASRQALVMVVMVYFGSWIISVLGDNKKTGRRMVSNICFIVIVGIILVFLISGGYFDVIYETKLYRRLVGSNSATTVSDAARWNMYAKGWKKFWEAPFLGVGFNYVKYIFMYTHSTFMELLIGTGMFGFFIFFIPFFKSIKNNLSGFSKGKNKLEKKYYAEKLLIAAVLIIMMITRSIVYYIFPMVVWTLYISDYNYVKKEEKENSDTGELHANIKYC